MDISVSLFNTALDSQFNKGARTYRVVLLYSAGESSPVTIDFTSASAGSVQLVASVFVAVASGTTVVGLQVRDDLAAVYLEESVADETFASNGTFTVNNIIVTLTD